MTLIHTPAMPDEAARRRAIAFLNLAHGIDHFVLLIYPTVVIGLEVVYGRPYSELIALSSAAFLAFGLFSLPAGWLADRWSRRNMMAAFYFGCGVSLIGVALAPNLLMLSGAMFALGMFAAIYHPVGMAMLIEASQARGRTLAFNGVCGNLGVSLAAGISGALASWIGWRAAFIAPALVSIASGTVYLWLTPDDRLHVAGRKSVPAMPLTPQMAVPFFGLFIVIALTAGVTFNVLTIALPKIVDERLTRDMPLVLIGSIATAVLICGALAQLTVGRLVERIAPHILFAIVTGLGALGNLWAASAASSWSLIAALAVAIAAIYGQVTVNDIVIAPLHRRRLARTRLCGALFPAVHQRRRRHRHDLAVAQQRRLRPGAGGERRHRAGDVPDHGRADLADFDDREQGCRDSAGGMIRTAAGSGPRL